MGITQPQKPKTRKIKEQEKVAARLRKQKQRSKLSEEDKKQINAKRREAYHAKKNYEKNQTPKPKESNPAVEGYSSVESKRKAASRLRKHLPNDSTKSAELIEYVIKNCTPRKKKILSQRCIVSPASKRKVEFLESATNNLLEPSKKRRNKKTVKLRQTIAKALIFDKNQMSFKKKYMKKAFGFTESFLCKASQMNDDNENPYGKSKRALGEDVIDKVKKFYNNQGISRVDPGMRSVSKKTKLPRSYLELKISNAYERFLTENPTINISMSKFRALRPSNVKTIKDTQLNQCLCEYCTNIEMKLHSLNSFLCRRHMNRLRIEDKYTLSRTTLCSKENEHYRKKCIDRQCENCGTQIIYDHLKEIKEKWGDHTIKYSEWENTFNQNQKKRKMIREKSSTFSEFCDALINELNPFSKHLVNAQWQSKQFSLLKETLPYGWLLQVLDFAENYTCVQQDEIQSAHWYHEMVTIHPIVSFFQCPLCQKVVKEATIYISNDKNHDSHFVQHIISICINIFKGRSLLITNLVQFTDGCASQYKGKKSFVDASLSVQDNGVPMEKHFYGSRHGKAPCDAEIGTLKRQARDAVTSRQAIINTPDEFFAFCQDKLTRLDSCGFHNTRQFVFIDKNDVDHERTERFSEIKPLEGTHQLHCIRGDRPYKVSYKERSCFCKHCLSGNFQSCPNTDFTGVWLSCSLKKNKRVKRDISSS